MSALELFEQQYQNTEKKPAREKAWQSFIRQGLPTLRHENWKYTNIQPIFKQALVMPSLEKSDLDYSAIIKNTAIENLPCYRFVIIDGQFSPERSSLPASSDEMEIIPLSSLEKNTRRSDTKLPAESNMNTRRSDTNLPHGATITHENIASVSDKELAIQKILSFSEALQEKHPFAALNAALEQNGFLCWIKPSTSLDKPIEILHINSSKQENAFYNARQLFLLGHHAKAEIVERFININETHYISNNRCDIVMEESSHLTHYRLNEQSNSAVHFNFISLLQEKDTHFDSFALDLGGRLTRTDLITKLTAPGAECILNGFYSTNGKELIDNHTVIEHASHHCSSKQFYKGIIDGSSRAVFNGKILVCDGAYATDAAQQNKNLLLSKTADINTKPELEIYADEVKCSHGTTVGQLNEESVFYLQARGIPKEQARSLLLYAFAQEMVEKIKNKAISDYVVNKVLAKLPDGNAVKECFE